MTLSLLLAILSLARGAASIADVTSSTGDAATTTISGVLEFTMAEENEVGHVLGNVASRAGIDMSSGKLRLPTSLFYKLSCILYIIFNASFSMNIHVIRSF